MKRKLFEYEEPVYENIVLVQASNGNEYNVDVSVWEEDDEYIIYIGESDSSDSAPSEQSWESLVSQKVPISWSWSDEDLDYMEEQCDIATDAIGDYFTKHPITINEFLKKEEEENEEKAV